MSQSYRDFEALIRYIISEIVDLGSNLGPGTPKPLPHRLSLSEI